MEMETETRALIELGDIDALIRYIDDLCTAQDWEEVLFLRDMSRAALERGKQLWSVASHAEYRLALEADGEFAAKVLVPGTGQFALGPLPEVAASTHSYADVAPFLENTPLATYFAHECVIRGEDLRDESKIDVNVLDLPPYLLPWEPHYPLAIYEPFALHASAPLSPETSKIKLPEPTQYKTTQDREVDYALRELVGVWTRESNGRCGVSSVIGGPSEAIGALGLRRAHIAPLSLDGALMYMAWAGGSGGAHGGRRGMAAGRFSTWWALAACCELLDVWPVSPQALGEAADTLKFWWFNAGEPDTGWNIRLAIHAPLRERAWAISAHDTFTT